MVLFRHLADYPGRLSGVIFCFGTVFVIPEFKSKTTNSLKRIFFYGLHNA